MAGIDPSPSVFERLFGKKKRKENIELPNESGKVDPRLKKHDMGETFDKMREGLGILGNMRKKRNAS